MSDTEPEWISIVLHPKNVEEAADGWDGAYKECFLKCGSWSWQISVFWSVYYKAKNLCLPPRDLIYYNWGVPGYLPLCIIWS